MEVIALVGPSGTGKSHRAILVAHDYKADVLIDDGLLIKEHDILAGVSAKKQTTAIGAIKTALFTDDAHADQVRQELSKAAPERLLVLGTSTEMVERITRRLQIPLPSLYLSIDQVATPMEIDKATKIRQHFGKHVIPAPTMAVKPRLSGVLTDPLQIRLPKKHQTKQDKQLWINQTVARPTFNYYGKFYITNTAMQEIIRGALHEVNDILKIQYIVIENGASGTTVNLDLVIRYGKPLPPLLKKVQKDIKDSLEHMTALHVLQVNLYVKKLVLDEK